MRTRFVFNLVEGPNLTFFCFFFFSSEMLPEDMSFI